MENTKLIITPESFGDCKRMEVSYSEEEGIVVESFNDEDNIFEPKPMFDYEEELAYIIEKTGLSAEIIDKVMDAQIDFLVSKGLAFIPEDDEE